MLELEVSGNKYKLVKMDTFIQFNVARKLLPVLTSFDSGDINVWANALANMPDDHAMFIVTESLKACSRLDGGGYRQVYNAGGVMMYQDIDLNVMIKLVSELLKYNLENFSLAQILQ